MPLDPAYPAERLRFMLEDSAPVVLLTQSHLQRAVHRTRATALPVLDLDDAARLAAASPESNPDPAAIGLTPSIWPMSSTPPAPPASKGVMVEHRNTVQACSAATEAWFHFGADDVWTLFHSFAFDFSVWEILGRLLYGATL